VVGGGFGGTHVVWNLERLCHDQKDLEVVLVSRDNFFLMTPFLFEACSGAMQLTHCSVPIRDYLRRTNFLEAVVGQVDLDRRVVRAAGSERSHYELAYDMLVLAPGSVTNLSLIKGSEHAFTFKALADAIALRNHMIERFERAEVETDPARKRMLLTVAIIGGGLVGVELLGELSAVVDRIVRFYPHVRRDEVRFLLLQAGSHIMPEIVPQLTEYAECVLRGRPGLEIRTETPVQAIEPQAVHLAGETIEAATIVLCAGIGQHSLIENLAVEKTRHGEIVVDATMRCPSHPEVWALGDCASIPSPDGTPYPKLAQHALREAKALARNLREVLCGRPPQPFVYSTKGIMGSLGHRKAFAQAFGLGIRGFIAWWLRRTYYLLQMPLWSRRLRLVFDWTAALLFPPDFVKLDLEREVSLLERETAAGGLPDTLSERRLTPSP
jgi:NADH dehydrogenase